MLNVDGSSVERIALVFGYNLRVPTVFYVGKCYAQITLSLLLLGLKTTPSERKVDLRWLIKKTIGSCLANFD